MKYLLKLVRVGFLFIFPIGILFTESGFFEFGNGAKGIVKETTKEEENISLRRQVKELKARVKELEDEKALKELDECENIRW